MCGSQNFSQPRIIHSCTVSESTSNRLATLAKLYPALVFPLSGGKFCGTSIANRSWGAWFFAKSDSKAYVQKASESSSCISVGNFAPLTQPRKLTPDRIFASVQHLANYVY